MIAPPWASGRLCSSDAASKSLYDELLWGLAHVMLLKTLCFHFVQPNLKLVMKVNFLKKKTKPKNSAFEVTEFQKSEPEEKTRAKISSVF